MRYLMLAVLGMLVLLTGVTATNPAYADPPFGAEVLHVCVDHNGDTEVVGPGGECEEDETAVHIPFSTNGGPFIVPTVLQVGTGSITYR